MDVFTVIALFATVYGYLMAAIALDSRFEPSFGGEDEGGELFFVLLVPALNEEQVIATTVSSLLGLPGNFLIYVIDDASDDGTIAAVTPFLADARVRLLERPPEQARTGKGDSLNAAFAEVRRLGLEERYGAENVIVVVFDSDGRVDPSFLQAVTPYFRDPNTAGVQSAVRMYNAGHNLLTFWQHLEFIVWGEVLCRAKDRLGSATLGGNGQCVRLSALASLGPHPWHASLVDDLDLALRLLVGGWRLRFCPSVSVWQEALPDRRRLVRQRSRWLQGHVTSWNYLPDLLRSQLPLHTRLDLIIFLLLPAMFLPVGAASIVSWTVFVLNLWLDMGRWNAVDFLSWYVIGFATAPLMIVGWRRTTDRPSLWRAVGHGHLFVFYSYLWFFASGVACWNVLLGRRSWAKTSRLIVTPTPISQPTMALSGDAR